LKQKGIPLKQLIADAGIWTTPSLDVLHFPFANNAFGREHYAAALGAKMTLSFRGSDLNVYPIYHNKSYSQLWPYVHKVQCNSAELGEKLKEHNIPEHIPIEIIPPALRVELQAVAPAKMDMERIGTPENPLIIVTLGRLHWVKDYPLALRIMSELKKSGIQFRYHILGEGADREQLMFLVHALGLHQEVNMHGRANAADIRQQLSRAHIYLQTSLAEGFSNACLEAQAFGLPCVVPAISGMNACIENGKTGIIVPMRTEKAFAEAILTVMSNIQAYNAAYTSARIKQLFSLESQKQQWLRFFDELFDITEKP
jgi:colanic acid/amylovoran biosynthesis glycosyltransferase